MIHLSWTEPPNLTSLDSNLIWIHKLTGSLLLLKRWDRPLWWAAILFEKVFFLTEWCSKPSKSPEVSIEVINDKNSVCVTCQGWVCGPASSSRCLWSVVHLDCHTASVWWIKECGRHWVPLRLWCYWLGPSGTCLCTGHPGECGKMETLLVKVKKMTS